MEVEIKKGCQDVREEVARSSVEKMRSEIIEMIGDIKTPSVILRCYQYVKYIYLNND